MIVPLSNVNNTFPLITLCLISQKINVALGSNPNLGIFPAICHHKEENSTPKHIKFSDISQNICTENDPSSPMQN